MWLYPHVLPWLFHGARTFGRVKAPCCSRSRFPACPRSTLISNPLVRRCPAGRPGRCRRTPPLAGRYCRLEPLDAARHADALFDAFSQAQDDRVWTYMVEGPFADMAAHRAYIERIAAKRDPLQYAVIDARTDRPVGTLALMRITPDHGVVEVGAVTFSPLLQRTPASTEAQFLLMKHVFRRSRLSALRMEVRQPERTIAADCATAGLPVRRHLPPGGGLQGPQP